MAGNGSRLRPAPTPLKARNFLRVNGIALSLFQQIEKSAMHTLILGYIDFTHPENRHPRPACQGKAVNRLLGRRPFGNLLFSRLIANRDGIGSTFEKGADEIREPSLFGLTAHREVQGLAFRFRDLG